MKKLIVIFFSVYFSLFCNFNIKIFQDQLDTLLRLPKENRESYIYKLITDYNKKTSFPLIDSENVVFVYWGNSKNVFLTGDFLPTSKKIKMENIKGTSFFYKVMDFEKDSKIEYNYIIDHNKLITDPLNKNVIALDNVKKSLLVMPEYNSYNNLIKNISDYPQGRIIEETIQGQKITIYLPYDYNANNSYKIFYILDGNSYLKYTKIIDILDRSIYGQIIKPSVFVLINESDFENNYFYNNEFNNLIINKIVPEIERKYVNNLSERVIISNGMASVQAIYLLANSKIFNRFISQSGLMGYSNYRKISYEDIVVKRKKSLSEEVATNSRSVSFYIIVGLYEKSDGGKFNNYKENIKFYNILIKNSSNINDIKLKVRNQGSGYRIIEDSILESLTWCN